MPERLVCRAPKGELSSLVIRVDVTHTQCRMWTNRTFGVSKENPPPVTSYM